MAAWPGKVGQGMDASFRAAAAQYRQAAPKLTHAQRVCRLYRNALKTQNSWAVDRQVFIAEADKMRAEFDKHAQLAATSVEARNLLERGEEKLFQESHPDRYIVAYLPGGSLYMRNAPLPLPAHLPRWPRPGGRERDVPQPRPDAGRRRREVGGRPGPRGPA